MRSKVPTGLLQPGLFGHSFEPRLPRPCAASALLLAASYNPSPPLLQLAMCGLSMSRRSPCVRSKVPTGLRGLDSVASPSSLRPLGFARPQPRLIPHSAIERVPQEPLREVQGILRSTATGSVLSVLGASAPSLPRCLCCHLCSLPCVACACSAGAPA